MIKYRIQYTDVDNNTNQVDISNDDYTGDIIYAQGIATLDLSNTDDVLSPIRGCGLKVELEASQDLDFSDLYTSVERTYGVTYYHNNDILFTGYLNADGYYEDFVNNYWKVTFDCVDGLGYLENIAFTDGAGNPFSGKMKQIDVLYNALARTGINKGMAVNIRIGYLGMPNNVCVLDNVYVIAERFIKDDGATIMSCYEVIASILETYGAILISTGDEWVIYRPGDMARTTNWTFYMWNAFNVYVGSEIRDYNTAIGNESDEFNPYHVNENQQISFKRSLGGHRISYKYGARLTLLDNGSFFSSDGTGIDNWTIYSQVGVTLPTAGNSGVIVDADSDGTSIDLFRSDDITLDAETRLNFYIRYTTSFATIGEYFGGTAYFQIKFTSGSDIYYLNNLGAWVLSTVTYFSFTYFASEGTFGFDNIQALPGDGDLSVLVRTPIANEYPEEDQNGNVTFERSAHDFKFLNANLAISEINETAPVGEFHNFERPNVSTYVGDIKEVFTGDDETDTYLGTTYKNDGTTNTINWTRTGFSESKPILQIMGEERMRIEQLPRRIFKGDVFGYFPFTNFVTIDGLPGKYELLEYSFNYKSQVTSIKLSQVFTDDLSDVIYTLSYDYGEVVDVTIKS